MKKIFNVIILVLTAVVLQAQPITYTRFMQSVAEKNSSYLAEKYNIDIAAANVKTAKGINDPELSVEYGNNQDWSLQMGQSVDVGLSYDINLAGSRRAGIRVAQTEQEMTQTAVAAFLSALRLEAAEAWAEAWRLRENVKVLEQAVADMRQVAASDSIRLLVGDVGLTDATQSKVEAHTLEGELIAMRAEYRNALMNLSRLCGGERITDLADDHLPQRALLYSEEEACRQAIAQRADLKEAELAQTLSENNLRLVKASRALDISLSVGYSYNTEVRNELAPAPQFSGFSVGVAIPIKFTSMNKGEKLVAQSQVLQSQKYYEAAQMQVRMEAAQAYNAFVAANEVLKKYDSELLRDAKQIVESRKVGYQRGESSLLEFLTAQQTYRDVMQAYIDACSNRYLCQAQLEYAIGNNNEP